MKNTVASTEYKVICDVIITNRHMISWKTAKTRLASVLFIGENGIWNKFLKLSTTVGLEDRTDKL